MTAAVRAAARRRRGGRRARRYGDLLGADDVAAAYAVRTEAGLTARHIGTAREPGMAPPGRRPAQRQGEPVTYGAGARTLVVEAGRRGPDVGQEDLLTDIAAGEVPDARP